MAHRKKIQELLENHCQHWNLDLQLIEARRQDFVWHLEHQSSIYEISYTDAGQLSLNCWPQRPWPSSLLRDIYDGDNSVASCEHMLSLLADNLATSH